KWVAKRICAQARGLGVPVNIFRAGLIGGDSEGRSYNLRDFTALFLKGCIQAGIAPMLEACIELIPADYVSRAVVHLALRGGDQTCHLVNPKPWSVNAFFAWLNERGHRVRQLADEDWVGAIAAARQEGERNA